VSASPDHPEDDDSAAVLGSLRDERARVLARITALDRDFHDIVERSSDASRDDEHDPEGATIAFERAQVSALLAAARAQLVEIDVAEARIERGEHDRCERCGAGIPAERRSARPTARTCVRCAG
jgi:DnaK suppressor protein